MSKHKPTTNPTFDRGELLAAIELDIREAWQAEQAEILRPGVLERIAAFTATLTAPLYRGRAYAQKQAEEAKSE